MFLFFILFLQTFSYRNPHPLKKTKTNIQTKNQQTNKHLNKQAKNNNNKKKKNKMISLLFGLKKNSKFTIYRKNNTVRCDIQNDNKPIL